MDKYIQPPLLKAGDTVSIVAPAGVIEDKSYIEKAINLFQSWNLKVKTGKNIFSVHHLFAGTDKQRLSDLQFAIDDEETKAIFCARGGYGCIRIIDQIHWNKFQSIPKWLIGFSDITAIHTSIQNLNIKSIHGLMPINLEKMPFESSAVELLKKALFEGNLEYSLPSDKRNINGTERAILVGGNLSLLCALNNTRYGLNSDGKILFIEDVGEHLYKLDRMIQNLRLSGKLEKISGLVIGGLSEMENGKRPFGKIAEEIIYDVVKDFNYPVAFNFPAGHIINNCPLILGAEVSLEVNSERVLLKI